jgi:tRNA (mo5U34)-methyltransferase
VNKEELKRRADQISWFHSMDLGQGVRTKGRYDPVTRFSDLHLPPLDGKSVLDIGAWDGAYSFEMERRGAGRVLATDHFCWSGPGYGTQDGFNLAREAQSSRVEDLDIDPHDLSADRVGRFDVVLFLGVLYHVKDPLIVLERVYDVTDGLLVLETEVDMLFSRRPAAAFYEGSELGADATNFWGPNPPAVLAMLREVGFRDPTVVSKHSAPRIAARAAYRRVRFHDKFTHGLRRDRVVFHAWR